MTTRKPRIADISVEQLAAELIGRNGKFHIMIAFMGVAPMACLILDKNGRVLYMNKLAEDHWGVKTKTALGQQFADLLKLSAKEAAKMARQTASVLKGSHPQVFLEMTGTGGKTRQSVFKFPFADDDAELLLGAFILPHGAFPIH